MGHDMSHSVAKATLGESMETNDRLRRIMYLRLFIPENETGNLYDQSTEDIACKI